MDDKVSNIKLKIINITIPLWRFVNESIRDEIQEQLNNLRNDKNKEVRHYADAAYCLLQSKMEEDKKKDEEVTVINQIREKAEIEVSLKEEREAEELK